jgi:hypothetical protein
MRCLSLAAERQEVNRSQVDTSDALPGLAARAANCHDDMRWFTLDPRDAWWCAPPTTRNPRHTTVSHGLPGHGGGLEIVRHPDSWVQVQDLGERRPYQPTFGTRLFINEAHRRFSTCPRTGASIDIGIPGALRREDALKLYEIAYDASGDGLGLGTGEGLATAIIGEAILASGQRDPIISSDCSCNRGAEWTRWALWRAGRSSIQFEGQKGRHQRVRERAATRCRKIVS